MGTIAVAAVGANSPIISLIVNLFIGIALGTKVVIANAIGRDDKKTVHHAVHTSILTAIVGGFVVTIIGELVAGYVLNSVKRFPRDVYTVVVLPNVETAIFRSVGDTAVPFKNFSCFRDY